AISPGTGTSYTVTLNGASGFASSVSFNVTGLPAGTNFTFAPPTLVGSGTTALNITSDSTVVPATYPLTISATDGVTTRTTSVTLVVAPSGDFSISVTPSSATVIQGSSAGYGITISSIAGFNNVVVLNVTGLPTGATQVLSPNSVTGSGLLNLTINTTASTPAGSYPLTITGTSGALVHTATVTLVVLAPDFSVSATPASSTILVGQSTNYSVTLSALNGYTGTVSFSVTGLPSGATPTFTPTSLKNSGNTNLSIVTDGTIVPGTYGLMITGTDGVLSHTSAVTLQVNAVPATDFTISAPATITVKRNSSGSETVTITPINGFNSPVTLTISGLPALVTGSFSVNPVPGSGTSKLTFTVDRRQTQGTFPLTLTGTSGLQSHSVPITLTVN
ncbi:MAG TPA: hypothetical protein VE783_04350, partial [Candidatus Limnocylindrales bacterium]|nr:hypothetical protein [Candidatus Limnocylindrales bacterium]